MDIYTRIRIWSAGLGIPYEKISDLYDIVDSVERHSNSLEMENKGLREKIKRMEEDRRRDEENKKNFIMENCNHVFGPVKWVDTCFYERVCRKCGYVETGYERD